MRSEVAKVVKMKVTNPDFLASDCARCMRNIDSSTDIIKCKVRKVSEYAPGTAPTNCQYYMNTAE